MSEVMEEETKRWTARLNSALVLEIIQRKTMVTTASRQLDLDCSGFGGHPKIGSTSGGDPWRRSVSAPSSSVKQ